MMNKFSSLPLETNEKNVAEKQQAKTGLVHLENSVNEYELVMNENIL